MSSRKLTPKIEATLESTSPERLVELAQDPKLAKIVAANPSAPVSLLRELFDRSGRPVRKALVINPSTPSDILATLCQDFPEQLPDNPVFDLLLLESPPNLLTALPAKSFERLLCSLAERENLLTRHLLWMVDQGNERSLQLLLRNPQTPTEVISRIQKLCSAEIRELAGLHISAEMCSAQTVESVLQTRKLPSDQEDWRLEYLILSGFLPLDKFYFLPELGRFQLSHKYENLPKDLKEKFIEISTHDSDHQIRQNVVAWTPDISIDLLVNLSQDCNGCVRAVVADHPNCPVELRHQLMSQLVQDSDVNAREILASSSNATQEILYQLSVDRIPRVRCQVALNSNCPTELLFQLSHDSESWVGSNVIHNPNCPVELLRKFSKDPNKWIRQCVAGHQSCPIDVLFLLAQDADSDIRAEVARNPNCSAELLSILLSDQEDYVRSVVAKHPACEEQTFWQLAQDQDSGVRAEIANDPRCPLPVLMSLSRDQESWIRSNVASNPHCPVEVLRALARDPEDHVRRTVVWHPNCPMDVLNELSKDSCHYVRSSVANQSNILPDLIENFALDGDSEVRLSLAENLNCPASLQEKLLIDLVDVLDSRDLDRLARHPVCPFFVLQKLAKNSYDLIREWVAGNPNCSAALLQELASDPNCDVRQAVAENAACPTETLEILARDKAKRVRIAVAGNAHTPLELMRKLVSDKDEDVRKAVLSQAESRSAWFPEIVSALAQEALELLLSSEQAGRPRLLALCSPHCPPAALEKNASSWDWLERALIASNPSTPESTLQALSQDGIRLVRQAAEQSLRSRTPATDLSVLSCPSMVPGS